MQYFTEEVCEIIAVIITRFHFVFFFKLRLHIDVK